MDSGTPAMSVGFPRMHKEAGERRDYLPELLATVADTAREVVIERGLGSGMGLADEDYTTRSQRIRAGSNAEAFAQDIVVTLRCPETAELSKIRPGATLVSMLHYSTRPARIEALVAAGIEGISLDGIIDDIGRRLVVNAPAVAWNGVEAAFDLLEVTWPPLRSAARPPVQGLVLGIGTIGRHAVEAVSNLGSKGRRDAYMAAGYAGVVVRAVGRNITGDERAMRELLATADVLVDASQRDKPSRPLVPNPWLETLPSHAVICDLVVDPVPAGRGSADRAERRGHPAWQPRPIRLRARRPDLERHDPRGHPDRAPAPRRVVLLVARRAPTTVHGAVRPRAGLVAARARRTRRCHGPASGRAAGRARPASRLVADLVGNGRRPPPRRPGRAPADLADQPRSVGP